MKYNLIKDTDSYKTSHPFFYPDGIESSFHYLESRGGLYDETVFCLISYLIKNYFSKKITVQDVLDAKYEFEMQGLPFPTQQWMEIPEKYNGYLPIRIRALPEGSVVPYKNVLLTIQGYGKTTFWIASWIESMVERLWYPITVASRSFKNKKLFNWFTNLSSDNPGLLDYRLHDFGARGSSCYESSLIAGSAHLLVFKGSDTIASHSLLREFYNTPEYISGSACASEHSTITSYGRENEREAYDRMLEVFGNPNSEHRKDFFACVSDSYDIYNAIRNIWGKDLKIKIKDYGVRFVARPDSGDPVETPIWTMNQLEEDFSSTINTKNYRVISDAGVIQGDGVSDSSIEEIVHKMNDLKFSIDNIVFGMGGELHQKLSRDTQSVAYKMSAILRNGVWEGVYKDPIGDSSKKSKTGRLDLIYEDGIYKTVNIQDGDIDHPMSQLIEYYDYGPVDQTFDVENIRSKINSYL